MSKNSRKIDCPLDNSPLNAKRKCTFQNITRIEPSENILWPEDEDESFFSNSKLVNLEGNMQLSSPNRHAGNSLHNINDSLFGSIKLDLEDTASASTVNNTTPPACCNSQSIHSYFGVNDSIFSDLKFEDNLKADSDSDKNDDFGVNDSIFSDLKFEDNLKADSDSDKNDDDLFADDLLRDCGIQNTQKFLDAVFKVPKLKDTTLFGTNVYTNSQTEGHFESRSLIEGPIKGSQYETSEEIKTRSILSQGLHSSITDGVHCTIDRINWETQVFSDALEPFTKKGDFYGLPERVKELIFEHKGIKSLYEWQDECLNLPAVRNRKNLIYALPTSGGKTLVAEILMLREIICRQKNVLFILPYVSIVQEKVNAMSPFAIALDFIVEEYTAGKGKCPPVARKKRRSVFIASIEKGAILIDSLIEAQRANEIGLVVVDELHLIGEKGRGATLEGLLVKVMFLKASIQIVGMSATIGNLPEISAFLNADVYTRGFRPVELKEYIKCGNDILEINSSGKTLEEVFVYKRSVHFKYSESVARADPDHLAGLVAECAPENSCLIFCSSRKNCENVAILLSRILPKSKFLAHRKSEKCDLMDALDKVCGVLSPVLAKTIPFGIAYHHSGLTTDERKFIETAYRFGVISVICCTSTLAAGVNLPAKRVIIRAPYVGAEFMSLCKYKQMIGRAGRAGMGEAGESILISSSRDNVRVAEMLFSPMDKALSSLDNNEAMGLQGLILSAIGLELAACRKDLYRLVNSTLLAVQAVQLDICMEDLVLKILRKMFKHKVLEICDNNLGNSTDIYTSQNSTGSAARLSLTASSLSQDRRIFISKTTRFKLSVIGRAAFKAGIDYKRTQTVYKELQIAQKQLLLSNYAHLLYLVVCFNSNEKGDELFAADANILFRSYNSLDENTRTLFNQLGFTEAQAAKIAKIQSVQGPMELTLNRLFKVLVLIDILNLVPLPTVSRKFSIERGMLQNMVSQAASGGCAIVRLCEQIEEFWCYGPLFERIIAKIDRCGTMELEPLLDLPGVKINRAKQLYAAGYKRIEDVANCRPIELVRSVEHVSLKVAKEIIAAAKIILMKKLDYLEEETEILKNCLKER